MTILRLDVELAGAQIVEAILGNLDLDGIGHEAITEANALILNRVRTRFLAQESPDGIAWEPSYAAFLRSFGLGRGKAKSGGGTLFDSGNLFHSIQLYEISPLEMAIGTDVPYAGYSNFGTEILPPREFMGFNDEDYDLAMNVLLSKIDEAFK